MSIRGIPRPNLVVVSDNEKGSTFLVQCEVPLDSAEAAVDLVEELCARTVAKMKAAKVRVLETVGKNPAIGSGSREIIEKAFDANIDYLTKG